jgi:hypothetical protein
VDAPQACGRPSTRMRGLVMLPGAPTRVSVMGVRVAHQRILDCVRRSHLGKPFGSPT